MASPQSLADLVLCASPLTNVTIREHLAAIDCNNMGGGSVVEYVPIDSLTMNVKIDDVRAVVEDTTISVELGTERVTAVYINTHITTK